MTDEKLEKAAREAMRRYAVTVTWMEPVTETFYVNAKDEDDAEEMVLDSDDVGEDATVDRVSDQGPFVPPPEPPDPNQLTFDEALAGEGDPP